MKSSRACRMMYPYLRFCTGNAPIPSSRRPILLPVHYRGGRLLAAALTASPGFATSTIDSCAAGSRYQRAGRRYLRIHLDSDPGVCRCPRASTVWPGTGKIKICILLNVSFRDGVWHTYSALSAKMQSILTRRVDSYFDIGHARQ